MKCTSESKPLLKVPFIVYPVLFAVFPILFLYAYNIQEVSVIELAVPVAASTAVTFLLWVILGLVCQSAIKGALTVSLFLLFFFFYGHFYGVMEGRFVFVPKHSLLLPGTLLVWGYCVYFIKIARSDFRNVTKILNMVSLALVIINLFTIVSHQFTTPSTDTPVANKTNPAETATSSVMPDIYHIILDEYAHPDTMKEFYNYDNSAFVNALAQKGFYIARNSKTQNEHTEYVISSIFNMEWVPETESPVVVVNKIRNNKVVDYLVGQLNYKSIALLGGIDWGLRSWGTDVNLNVSSDSASVVRVEFGRILLNTTMLRPFVNRLAGASYQNSYRLTILETLEQLKKVSKIEGPKFVYAHFVSPHEPFVFGPRGEDVAAQHFHDWKDKQFYLGQYVFITREIDKVIDEILKNSVREPIIILQSDHGIKSIDGIPEKYWRDIFNAYYFPGDGEKPLYDSISPVDTYRFIFNQYFGANYTLLKDQSPTMEAKR